MFLSINGGGFKSFSQRDNLSLGHSLCFLSHSLIHDLQNTC